MKLQYVGDCRDFYKYDLLLALGRSLQLSGGLTVIPMLTPPPLRQDRLTQVGAPRVKQPRSRPGSKAAPGPWRRCTAVRRVPGAAGLIGCSGQSPRL